jgi:DEAD/DEAH box helicase/Helicase conserved C-terminal domain
LLSAAAYQVAGYPAMALGALRRLPEDDNASVILARFLEADFPAVLRALHMYWQQELAPPNPRGDDEAEFSLIAVQHVIRCVGTICVGLRFGTDDMLERAISKLDRLASGFLHSRDSYSAILARLVGAVARNYAQMSLWRGIAEMESVVASTAHDAFVQFARAQFINRRVLIWPAQATGISRLREGHSFALCTPTGSGKTTVATLGIIPALFEPNPNLVEGLAEPRTGNLVLYLVPSRALAAEVEERLEQDLRGVSAERIVVTGLYGGTDWGPTDAWISQDQPTILICTYEKADALLRFLGVLFLNRVRLVVVDEAHMVNYGKAEPDALRAGSSRPFRLELLGTRLNLAREIYSFRTIALSAVAAAAAPSLARWISGAEDAIPTESSHRSTRQMLGRIEVNSAGSFTIRYDLLNGQSLKFSEGRTTLSPFIGEPFPRMPERLRPSTEPEIRMRAPTLWAALNLASERNGGTKPTVLISIAQSVDTFSESCLDLLDRWQSTTLPVYFEADRDDNLLSACLASMADYFSEESFEYRLLARGIAVHHGKMPSPIARRLKRLIDRGKVRVIIATSTLSEGVNIPVNYILMPRVFRGQTRFELQEFSNLIGRAGRPGVATEGHALVVLAEDGGSNRQRRGYEELRDRLERSTQARPAALDAAQSPLAALLISIETEWRALTRGGTRAAFERWLSETAVTTAPGTPAILNLDCLDYFLLSALGEVEQLRDAPLENPAIEEELQRVWRSTYAHASGVEEARLRSMWLGRGRAIPMLYPDRQERVRLYKTSLTPRSALALLDLVPAIVDVLQTGAEYGVWSTEERFQ